jgi:hypothetical protein
MSEKETKKSGGTLMLAAALVLGAVVGAAVSSRGDDAAKALERRVDALETALEERAAAAEQALAEELDLKASAITQTTDYLTGRIDAIERQAAEAVDSAGEAMKPVQDRVSVMAQQMAGLIGRVTSLESGSGQAGSNQTGSAQSGGAASGAAGDPGAAPSETAETSEQASAGNKAQALEESLGDDGAALSVGQTARFGEEVLFLSRIDAESGAVRMIVVGQGPVMIGGENGAFEMGDGCRLELLGVESGKAYLKPAC